MPELLLELFSEEIPARMQARAADDLFRLVGEALAPLAPANMRTFFGPRRIALAAEVAAGVAAGQTSERGPRRSAPDQAVAGFLRKHGASHADLREDGDYWVLDRTAPGIDAAALVARELPGLLRRFPWLKSMRWGGSSAFTWVRPLRRILCLLDGAVVPFDLRDGADDGHGLASANLTEGHRFLAPDAFAVSSFAAWQTGLRERRVIVDAAERRALIATGILDLAQRHGLAVVEDTGLLDEVAGLVEWPVVLLGRIDPAYMDLPAEVMQVSMRVNQRYFALRDAAGRAAPFFAFVANIAASDGGATIIAGNERVLRARFADARHFWDLDRAQTLESRVPALDKVTFHAKLGSQGERVQRLEALARVIAPLVGADPGLAQRAAALAKADLVTGMVGEFPELQGVMGRYYALHDREDASVADAIRDHYGPKGPTDAVPHDPVGIAVALADKIDLLAGFFAIGEKPTGSGDPYALRRAALGIIRIVRERGLRLALRQAFSSAYDPIREDLLEQTKAPVLRAVRDIEAATSKRPKGVHEWNVDLPTPEYLIAELTKFVAERLYVQLRAEGARHDVLAAVLGLGVDDDLVRLLARTDAVADLLGTDDGRNLLAAYKRAANILRIEEKKDGPHDGAIDPAFLEEAAEVALAAALDGVEAETSRLLAHERFGAAMEALAALRPKLDAFFDQVTVNAPRPELRRNRLRLLARLRAAMNLAADFSKIEG
jgi:glycyl-tRNA synthetase beta chain